MFSKINTQFFIHSKKLVANIIIPYFHEIVEQYFKEHTLICIIALKNTNGTGFATIVKPLVKTYKHYSFISIYTVETYAIYKEAQYSALSNIELINNDH